MDKEHPGARQAGPCKETAQLHSICLWAAVIALIVLYTAAITCFLAVWSWLLPLVALVRLASEFSTVKVRKQYHEKNTQSEQVPPTCHDNILYDLVEPECLHIRTGCSHDAPGAGYHVRSNDAYDPVWDACSCQRNGDSGSLACTFSSITAARAHYEPLSQGAGAISTGLITPICATPSPLHTQRPASSPLPSPATEYRLAGPQFHQHEQLVSCCPLLGVAFGLLSPEQDFPTALPQPPLRSPAVASVPIVSAPTWDAISTTATASSSADACSNPGGVLFTATLPPSPAKLHGKDLAASAPSSRRPSFGNPPPQRRHMALASAVVATSSLSIGRGGSISMSSDPGSSVSGVTSADVGKPSYMRGTAASRAKASNATEPKAPSRLGCSTKLASRPDVVNRRVLAGTAHRASARY